jgi:YD repeat-containing protein
MPSKMRYGLIIGIAVVGLFFASVLTSYAETVNYIYDELNRLKRVEYGDGAKIEYTYDEAGNRSQVYVGEYTLSVNVVGDGTVTKNPDQPIYGTGTNVTLTAVNGSQTFSEWSGDLTGNTNPTTIVMNGNKSVTATFVTPQGWLQGWTYRKPVTLSRASGAVTNYQMKLLVGESSGAVGYNVHCNGHVLSSFNDLRFTNSDGTTLLDYWIESITGTTPNRLATVWVKFDSIGTSQTTFYMYYGKSDAPAVSNGANTFIVFDDFERGSDGDEVGGIWTEYEGTVEISTVQKWGGTRSMRLKGLGGGVYPRIRCNLTASDNIGIMFRFYKEDLETVWLGHGNGTNNLNVSLNANTIFYVHNGSSWINTTLGVAEDVWQLIKFDDFNWPGKLVDCWRNEAKKDNVSMQTSTVNTNLLVFVGDDDSGYDAWIDNFIVRNFRTTEPAWGSWGAEETN